MEVIQHIHLQQEMRVRAAFKHLLIHVHQNTVDNMGCAALPWGYCSKCLSSAISAVEIFMRVTKFRSVFQIRSLRLSVSAITAAVAYPRHEHPWKLRPFMQADGTAKGFSSSVRSVRML